MGCSGLFTTTEQWELAAIPDAELVIIPSQWTFVEVLEEGIMRGMNRICRRQKGLTI
jgi:hypothetical protein